MFLTLTRFICHILCTLFYLIMSNEKNLFYIPVFQSRPFISGLRSSYFYQPSFTRGVALTSGPLMSRSGFWWSFLDFAYYMFIFRSFVRVLLQSIVSSRYAYIRSYLYDLHVHLYRTKLFCILRRYCTVFITRRGIITLPV